MADARHLVEGDSLMHTALLYAAGELEPDAERAFELKLAEDQTARDALSHAVQLTLTLEGRSQRPDPTYRTRVRDVMLSDSWWTWLARPRIRRGPAIAWMGLGTAAALGFMMIPEWFQSTSVSESPSIPVVEQRTEPETTITAMPTVPTEVIAASDATPESPPVPSIDMDAETAALWEEMSNSDHLQRMMDEEQRRRAQRNRELPRRGDEGSDSRTRILNNSGRGSR